MFEHVERGYEFEMEIAEDYFYTLLFTVNCINELFNSLFL